MRRPRPIQRLIDGRPDDSGRTIARRALWLTPPALIGANMIGALVVYVLAAFIVPGPEVDNTDEVLIVNLVAVGTYVVAAGLVGTIWGNRALRPIIEWLRSERPATDSQRRMVLRAPVRTGLITATGWAVAVVVFTILNAAYSWGVAATVGFTVALGGVTTSAAAYLTAERLIRPVVARALASGVPDRPALPGIVTRSLLAWALGTAVAVVGLVLVAVASLVGRDVDEYDVAVTALGLGGVALVVGAIVTWQAARSISAPVLAVRDALRRVEAGDLDTEVPVFDASELGLLQAGFNRMQIGLRERERIRDLFGRQVGEDVARAALERGVELGGEERDIAVLFVDITGSTTLAAERPPTEVVELLNRFFEVVVDIVEVHGGLVNKFEGDAALAVFGAPIPRDDATGSALAAARELHRRLCDEVPELDAGIGVSAGRAVAGNIGAERRFEYTVIGDPVNEAARLCELAKSREGRVVGSATAVEAAGEDEAGHWRLGDEVELRGRTRPTRLAEPALARR